MALALVVNVKSVFFEFAFDDHQAVVTNLDTTAEVPWQEVSLFSSTLPVFYTPFFSVLPVTTIATAQDMLKCQLLIFSNVCGCMFAFSARHCCLP